MDENILEKELVDKIFLTTNMHEFWKASEEILEFSNAWEQVEFIKEKGAEKFAKKLFKSFLLRDDGLIENKDEEEGIKIFGLIMNKCIKNKDYKTIAKELLRMTLGHLLDLYGIKYVKDLKNLDIKKDILSNISQEMFMSFTIFSSLVMCKVFENLDKLSASEKEEFYALSLGLWQELQSLIMIEDPLRYKNPKRKKQINEFMDEWHEEAVEKYDNIMEADLTLDQSEKEMQKLIEEHPYYFDPYRSLMDIYLEKEAYHEMEEIAREGYKKALSRIVDYKGRWPKLISWHYMENRHLVRMLDRFASDLWEDGRESYAIEIYRKLLRSNPGDNIGARYNILAIHLGYQFGEAEDNFPAKHPGYVDAIKMDNWFQKNALDFPDEFEWWFEYEEKNNQ